MFALCNFFVTKDLYLFLLTKRDPKRIFAFMKRGKKQKQHSVFVLQQSRYGGNENPQQQQEGPRQAPSPGTTLSITASSRHSFEMCL